MDTVVSHARWLHLAIAAALAATSALLVPISASADVPPPLSISTPTITGTLSRGATLTATAKASAPVAYQWYRGQTEIADATGPSYTLVPADVGHRMWVTGTVNGVGLAQIISQSVVTPRVTEPFAETGTVAITRVGHKLRVTTSGWAPHPHLSFRWFANGKKLAHEHDRVLTITKALKGKKIAVRVTATLDGYTSAVATASLRKTA